MTSNTPSLDLSPHLAERICSRSASPRRGTYVLYWMRASLRGHENPALDTAIEVANEMGLPVVVYQGLSERYRYSNDRLHTFILESARDAQRELASRGVGFALHVERPGRRGRVLEMLAEEAALVVTEEFPVAPLRGWTLTVARRAPLWTVDAACVLPMTLTACAPSRAFRFRDENAEARAQRVTRVWREALPSVEPFQPRLPFPSIDLRDAASNTIPDLVAACEIDHTVGPVPHTQGGVEAAYQRWDAFVQTGLSTYHKRRNDPLVAGGVSRMSPYLHFGCASPMRLVREAAAADTPGAAKYLDELLIWRELAWHYCFHTADTDTLEALPEWAQQTLRTHAKDPRPSRYDWESLARARTGDPLWDAAQRSLLVHGELHNNVRMTWGKALLGWTESPEEALQLLTDLNHRYALDGRDPASYGGLLWCLGLFDRPFEPEAAVRGVLRARSTRDHSQRLDVEAYDERVRRPARDGGGSVAVVGAGLAGLTCARVLHDHGLDVTLVEKSRGPSGRMSTRRRDGYAFDHGAQFFTARNRDFLRHVSAWAQQGVVAPWEASLVTLGLGAADAQPLDTEARFVGAPRMSSLARHLAQDLPDVRYETRVQRIERQAGRFMLFDDSGESLGEWSHMVVTVPGPQAKTLFEPFATELAAQVDRILYEPCWALMVDFTKSLGLRFDGARLEGSALSWAARDSSKPGRVPGERWVLHASPQWSVTNLEAHKADVAHSLLNAFAEALQRELPPASHAVAHRWRFARVRDALGVPCLFDPAIGLVYAGDGCLGPRVESAWLSGAAAAGRVLGHLGSSAASTMPTYSTRR